MDPFYIFILKKKSMQLTINYILVTKMNKDDIKQTDNHFQDKNVTLYNVFSIISQFLNQ